MKFWRILFWLFVSSFFYSYASAADLLVSLNGKSLECGRGESEGWDEFFFSKKRTMIWRNNAQAAGEGSVTKLESPSLISSAKNKFQIKALGEGEIPYTLIFSRTGERLIIKYVAEDGNSVSAKCKMSGGINTAVKSQRLAVISACEHADSHNGPLSFRCVGELIRLCSNEPSVVCLKKNAKRINEVRPSDDDLISPNLIDLSEICADGDGILCYEAVRSSCGKKATPACVVKNRKTIQRKMSFLAAD